MARVEGGVTCDRTRQIKPTSENNPILLQNKPLRPTKGGRKGKKLERLTVQYASGLIRKSRLNDRKMQVTCLSQVGKIIHFMYNINYNNYKLAFVGRIKHLNLQSKQLNLNAI